VNVRLRHVHPADYDRVTAVIDDWWGGRPMAARLSHVFFTHFRPTSFVLEDDGELLAFLLGFISQTYPEEACVHFVGVRPDYRRLGLARRLYESFFTAARASGCAWCRSITSPANLESIAFHRSLGFRLQHGDVVADGVPITLDYAGAGGHRVVFLRDLAPREQAASCGPPVAGGLQIALEQAV
jgi:GNAT superfamily N-acetyltransferase